MLKYLDLVSKFLVPGGVPSSTTILYSYINTAHYECTRGHWRDFARVVKGLVPCVSVVTAKVAVISKLHDVTQRLQIQHVIVLKGQIG